MVRKYTKSALSRRNTKKRGSKKQYEMATLDLPGMMLRKKRLDMNLSLKDISEKIFIKETILNDIEEEKIYNQLHLTHIRGFLRKYVSYLEEDPDEFLELIKVRKGLVIEKQLQDYQLPIPLKTNSIWQWLFALSFLIIAIIIVLWWQRHFIQEKIIATQQAPLEVTSLIENNIDKNIINNDIIIDDITNNNYQTDNNDEDEIVYAIPESTIIGNNKTVDDTQNKSYINNDNNIIFIKKIVAIADVWVSIKDSDDNDIYTGILHQNNHISLDDIKTSAIIISTGRAGDLIYYNSENIPISLGIGNDILQNHKMMLK